MRLIVYNQGMSSQTLCRHRNNESPLAKLRKRSGLTAERTAEKVRVALKESHRHLSSITKMEKHGSDKLSLLHAYAEAIGATFEEVRAASELLLKAKNS